jgi:hypothetical protein
MLVGDPGQQMVRKVGGVVDQEAGEGCYRPGQGLLLPPVGLVPAVEKPVQQFRVSFEHVGVKARSYFLDILADHREGGLDDRERRI